MELLHFFPRTHLSSSGFHCAGSYGLGWVDMMSWAGSPYVGMIFKYFINNSILKIGYIYKLLSLVGLCKCSHLIWHHLHSFCSEEIWADIITIRPQLTLQTHTQAIFCIFANPYFQHKTLHACNITTSLFVWLFYIILSNCD